MLPVLVLLGAGFIATQASIQTLVQTLVDDDKRGRAMSPYTLAFLEMLLFGNLAAGAIARYAGEATAYSLNGFLCLAGLFVSAERCRSASGFAAGSEHQARAGDVT